MHIRSAGMTLRCKMQSQHAEKSAAQVRQMQMRHASEERKRRMQMQLASVENRDNMQQGKIDAICQMCRTVQKQPHVRCTSCSGQPSIPQRQKARPRSTTKPENIPRPKTCTDTQNTQGPRQQCHEGQGECDVRTSRCKSEMQERYSRANAKRKHDVQLRNETATRER